MLLASYWAPGPSTDISQPTGSKSPFQRFLDLGTPKEELSRRLVSGCEGCNIFQSFFFLPFVSVVIDPADSVAVDDGRQSRVLHLAVGSFSHCYAKSFPNLGQCFLRTGEEKPAAFVGFEQSGIGFKCLRVVSCRIGGDADEQVIGLFLLLKGSLHGREFGAQERADVRALGVDEIYHHDFSPRIGPFKPTAQLIG